MTLLTYLQKNIKMIILKLILFDVLMALIYLVFTYNSNHWTLYKNHKDDSLYDKFFNRFYYSLQVSSTLGLGPIIPDSKTSMFLTIVQIYVTISLFPFLGI